MKWLAVLPVPTNVSLGNHGKSTKIKILTIITKLIQLKNNPQKRNGNGDVYFLLQPLDNNQTTVIKAIILKCTVRLAYIHVSVY